MQVQQVEAIDGSFFMNVSISVLMIASLTFMMVPDSLKNFIN